MMNRGTLWASILVVHLGLLTLCQSWRSSSGLGEFVLLKGSLPNFLAVPVLWSGLLMFRYVSTENGIRRSQSESEPEGDRVAIVALAIVTAIVVIWEFLQLSGKLVFDPIDLIFTALGVFYVLALYRCLKPWHRNTKPAIGESLDETREKRGDFV